MVSAWGGYVFIINLIPLHVLVLIVIGRYTSKLYVGRFFSGLQFSALNLMLIVFGVKSMTKICVIFHWGVKVFSLSICI